MFELMIPRRSRRSALSALPDVRALDALFDDLWRGFGAPPAPLGSPPGFSPRIDVRETGSEIVVRAELPGLDEKDFEVSLQDGVLTLRGEKKSAHEEVGDGIRHLETRSGRFERWLRLPCEVRADEVRACFDKGVLTVTLPKPEKAEPEVRTISVTTG